MSQGPAPLRDRLRSIDAPRAKRQTRLIAALNQRAIEGATLTARVAFERDRRAAAAWIRFRAGDAPVLLAPLLVDGALVRLSLGPDGPDAAVAAALLARIEPLVVAIEQALGRDLYPEGLETGVVPDAILLRIDAGAEGGSIRHRLIVAFPPEGQVVAPVLPRAIPGLLGALRVRWRATLAGPPLRATRIATIRVGDMLLLGLRPLLAQITFPGRIGQLPGRLDLIRGIMTLQNEPADNPASERAAAQDTPDSIDWEGLKVSTVIEIDGGTVSAGDVAALGGGSVLPLPSSGAGTLSVRVVAGGAVIGTGELVAIGDGFGVLFTSVTSGGDVSVEADQGAD